MRPGVQNFSRRSHLTALGVTDTEWTPASCLKNVSRWERPKRRIGWLFPLTSTSEPSLGERALREYSAQLNKLALEVLDGRDYRQMPREADEVLKNNSFFDDPMLGHQRDVEKTHADWLNRNQSTKRLSS